MSTVEEKMENKTHQIDIHNNVYLTGRITAINDYMVEVSGLDRVAYFEKVIVQGKGEGYVTDIRPNCVIVAMMKITNPCVIGDEVVPTNEEYQALFSPEAVGCIVDIFGNDKLVDKKFEDVMSFEIETGPIPIIDRIAVNEPLCTGISGIDLLYPIGRGQRQLIIGDKKTGKTQIALDTIVNQRDNKIVCIYVAIGKNKKEVKNVYAELKKHGAMEYTIIVAALNDETAPVLRATPYAALSLAEKLMKEGVSTLVIIDDLKRHADVLREMSLLMDKAPGRDAYPPDVFYAHASMLEKGCHYKNGSSITILPLVETRGSDITDYISTNIISITDGQIVLSAKNFAKGQKPAINYGLSVSRLGGAVQTQQMRQVGTSIRRQLLSYLETREVYELANVDEMSPALRKQMIQGKEILDGLNQYKYEVMSPNDMLSKFDHFTR